MKKLACLFGLILALGLSVLSGGVIAEELRSLRGTEAVKGDVPSENYRYERDKPAQQRQWVQQPPIIPHTTKGYLITKEFNKCLDCHSWNRATEAGAPRVSVTHFKTRDGKELAGLSPRRYFCVQCHVPQTDAKPLVGNTFKSADGLVK
ncbi:nitrate reductase cytochrome c-type subunit [Chitinibacter bivalviorum]|uniref:Periplasmic nitrate reductase, electron transfer subunit n=1 Tax=Chitinibacter bivalviorum TaxID=2739434 RepID=A0A7H9BHR4_9NEIS|nr:nitrate reductase cytochrome c-type subunit [Chitinibacter bivalviorum]QLG87748.1 nitrate reductase cytochrome c-type subunit [Chitinibacter bivalviorum]